MRAGPGQTLSPWPCARQLGNQHPSLELLTLRLDPQSQQPPLHLHTSSLGSSLESLAIPHLVGKFAEKIPSQTHNFLFRVNEQSSHLTHLPLYFHHVFENQVRHHQPSCLPHTLTGVPQPKRKIQLHREPTGHLAPSQRTKSPICSGFPATTLSTQNSLICTDLQPISSNLGYCSSLTFLRGILPPNQLF